MKADQQCKKPFVEKITIGSDWIHLNAVGFYTVRSPSWDVVVAPKSFGDQSLVSIGVVASIWIVTKLS